VREVRRPPGRELQLKFSDSPKGRFENDSSSKRWLIYETIFLIIQIKKMRVKQAVKTVTTRIQKPTPKFFQKLRNVGVVVAAIAGTILAAPVALPAVLVKLAGYLTVAGGVMGAVSQTAVKGDK
jgi:hypothetical protein